MHNGAEKILPTMFWTFEAPVSKAPFYYDGMTYDEYFVEMYYFSIYATSAKYKTLRKQLEDGDIINIPDEYKALCPHPDSCTAFRNLVKIA